MKNILIPCFLLVACSGNKETIVDQIMAEKNNLAKLETKNSEYSSRILKAYTNGNNELGKKIKDSGFAVEMEIMAVKAKIDSLQLELKKY